MAIMTHLEIPVDQELKNQAESIFSKYGLSMENAVELFFKAVIREKDLSLILDLEIPNQVTLSAIEEGRKIATDKSVKGFATIDSLKSSLEV